MFQKLKSLFNRPKTNMEYLTLGHMLKYNLYFLSKAIIFSSFVSKLPEEESITQEQISKIAQNTESALRELDLANKVN